MVGKSEFENLCIESLSRFESVDDASNWIASQLDDLVDREAVLHQLILKAIKVRLYDIRQHDRNSRPEERRQPRAINANTTTVPPKGDRDIKAAALEKVGEETMVAIMEYYFVGNVRLADCTRVDLMARVEDQDHRMAGMKRHRDFCFKIASGMKDDNVTVREAYDNDSIEAIHDELITSQLEGD